MRTRDDRWFADAACRGMDPEIFYHNLDDSTDWVNEGLAREICAGCPVRMECIDWAITQKWTEEGYWGSTKQQRTRLKSRFNGMVTRYEPEINEVAVRIADLI